MNTKKKLQVVAVSFKIFPLYLLLLLLIGCSDAIKKIEDIHPIDSVAAKTVNNKSDTSIFYTTKDTVVLTAENLDTLNYSKQEFNAIVANFPELYFEDVQAPDITYAISSLNAEYKDQNGNTKRISFASEAGQDEYYRLYAYFLKQRSAEKYNDRRQKLITIYCAINSIFAQLHVGGTYFGHQYIRILAHAEYSIDCYTKREDFFTKTYKIDKQKQIYINSLKQIIKDEMIIEKGTLSENTTEHNKSITESIKKLDSLITDNFYLKRAQVFQYNYY